VSVAVILTHGVPPSRETLSRALGRASLFVCADGAADNARAMGFEPHVIIGDLDSVTAETLAASAASARTQIVRDADQESTDTEKAIRHVLDRGGFTEIVLLGAAADRLDHVVGHLSLFLRYSSGTVRLVLEDDRVRAWVAGGTVSIDEPPGTVVSFFAIGSPAEGVTTQGLRYPLTDRRLEMGVQDSISNVVDRRPASVRIANGRLLVFIVRQP